jgi:hypothetical protein
MIARRTTPPPGRRFSFKRPLWKAGFAGGSGAAEALLAPSGTEAFLADTCGSSVLHVPAAEPDQFADIVRIADQGAHARPASSRRRM